MFYMLLFFSKTDFRSIVIYKCLLHSSVWHFRESPLGTEWIWNNNKRKACRKKFFFAESKACHLVSFYYCPLLQYFFFISLLRPNSGIVMTKLIFSQNVPMINREFTKVPKEVKSKSLGTKGLLVTVK